MPRPGNPRMGLDRIYIGRALAELSRYREYLRSRVPATGAELEQDFTLCMAVLHTLQLSIQLVLDIGAHLLADSAAGPIDEYGDIGPRLAGTGVIPVSLGATLTRMARFRNLLVHQYAEVDLDRVVSIVASGLSDLEAFETAVRAYLERRAGEG